MGGSLKVETKVACRTLSLPKVLATQAHSLADGFTKGCANERIYYLIVSFSSTRK